MRIFRTTSSPALVRTAWKVVNDPARTSWIIIFPFQRGFSRSWIVVISPSFTRSVLIQNCPPASSAIKNANWRSLSTKLASKPPFQNWSPVTSGRIRAGRSGSNTPLGFSVVNRLWIVIWATSQLNTPA